MVYYVAIKDKIEKQNVPKIIKELDNDPRVFMDERINPQKEERLKKAKVIICDNQKNKIEDFKKYKKPIIIYTGKQNAPEEYIGQDNIYTYNKKNDLREIITSIKKQQERRNKLLLAAFSLLGIFVVVLLVANISIRYHNLRLEAEQASMNQIRIAKEKAEEWEKENKMKKENIVFLGDSITQGYNLKEYYQGIPSINSGVSGYCTDDIYNRLKEFVYVYNPTKVVLLIGTNDIVFRNYGKEGIINNIKEIIESIKQNRSKTTIYVESLYPINKSSYDPKINFYMIGTRENGFIEEINESLKALCEEEKVNYIDVYHELLDTNGNLNIEYTRDGLHMSDAGYQVVTKKIKESLDLSN